jgi:hypothetical protein
MAKRNTTASAGRLHRTLRLQHHKHTGRMLHHKHTSYRGLMLILVLAGAFMVAVNVLAHVTADQLNVYASIMAAVPADPAVITSPADGSTVSKSSLIVKGACPSMTERGSVAILDNGTFAGSAPCDTDDTFSLSISLTPGNHTLVARIYTITNEAGPDSTPVDVSYIAPAPVESAAQAAADAEPAHGPPFQVTIDKPFIIFSPETDAEWSGTMTGGTLPYRVHFDWDDGSASDYTVRRSGEQSFRHHYTSMESHLIRLYATDADGRSVIQDYAAVTPYRGPISSALYANPPKPHFGGSSPISLYGIYLLLLAIFGLIWIKLRPREFAYAKVPVRRASRYAGARKQTRHKSNRT